ncbi:MAG: hypothetical protein HYV61_00225 [Candidatus Rokubacteria bacterium]|nr:hypothetical protein [Candidatus Rokubacteria bacterium]
MLKLLAIALRLVGLGMMVPILLFLTVAAAQFVDGARDYPLIREVISLTRPVSRSIQQHVPTKIKGYDATPWMVIVFALAVRMACRNYADRLWSHAEYLAHKRALRRLRAARPANVEALKPVEAKLEELKQAPRKDRDALLRQFIEAKKRLEEERRTSARTPRATRPARAPNRGDGARRLDGGRWRALRCRLRRRRRDGVVAGPVARAPDRGEVVH